MSTIVQQHFQGYRRINNCFSDVQAKHEHQ